MAVFIVRIFRGLRWRFREMIFVLTRLLSWPVRLFRGWFQTTSEKNILFRCDSLVMAEHLRDFWELFQNDSRLRFSTWFPAQVEKNNSDKEPGMDECLPVSKIGPFSVYSRNWDLIVVPSHAPHMFAAMRTTPAVYIGHGPHSGSEPGETGALAYGKSAFDGKGRPFYRRMFVSEHSIRDLAIQHNPVLSDVVAVVGSIANDKLLAKCDERDEIRRGFGFQPNDIVVFVLSTWRKQCLFETVGDAFLEEAKKLTGEFKFVLTVHPNEYLPKPPGQRVWGEYLRTQKQYGFIVREPSEDWKPYIVACDIILTDHTCVAEYGVILGKPIIRVPVPDGYIWEGSVTWKIGEFAPVLSDMRNLSTALREAKTNYPMGKLKGLANEMNPYAGQSAERIKSEIYKLLGLVD